MYNYVSKKVVSPYRQICAEVIQPAISKLNKAGIGCIFESIGSARSNMITQQGNSLYDLDYNIKISKISEEYDNRDYRKLKHFIRLTLDQIIREKNIPFSYGKDHTSAIIYTYQSNGRVVFKMDIGILIKNTNQNWCRLKNDKPTGNYILNEICSDSYSKKLIKLIRKDSRKWNECREIYLKLKDNNIKTSNPALSFELFTQALYETAQKYNIKP